MYTISEIKEITGAFPVHLAKDDALISELCFDSRKMMLPEKSLFFAIKTERNDGHDFIEPLIRKGVVNFIITRDINDYRHYAGCNFLQVENAVLAMQQIAKAHREKFSIPIIGITGSNGKTILKEWLSRILAENEYLVANPNSYNSQIGVPFSVWQMKAAHTLGIFEAGISRPGEMEHIARIIQPTIGILTNIGKAHAAFFKNHQEKLIEKLQLFNSSEVLIYNNDNQEIETILQQEAYTRLKKISWGHSPNSLYKIGKKEIEGGDTRVEINTDMFVIPFTDKASVENAIQAIVTLLYLTYPVEEINRKMATLTPLKMRMEIVEAPQHSIVINDTYSLDINSLRIALDYLNAQSRYPKKTLIISDFDQVALLSEEDYLEIHRLLQDNGISKLIAIGAGFHDKQHLFTLPEQYFYLSTGALLADSEKLEMQQEAVLVKGARNFHFEKIIDRVQLKTHQAILNVNLSAIIHNLNYHRSLLKPETRVIAMVKAWCYGLGDVELINELCYHRVDYLAVAYADEGVHLRLKNVKTPIIVLGAEAHSFETMVRHQLEPEIYNFHFLQSLEKILENHPEITTFPIHIKVDTGMHRLGFDQNEVDELICRVKRNPKLKVATLFSHLAAAEDEKEDDYTRSQIRIFEQISREFENAFNYPIAKHLLNSAGIIRFPEAQYDMVRLGLGLYGFSNVEKIREQLQNVVTFKTLVTQVKSVKKGETIGYNRTYKAAGDMEVAMLPVGYADGYPRALSNGKGKVLIKDHIAPVVGMISMDMTVIDVTGLDVQIGDEVVIYDSRIRVDTIASSIQTIPYELLTSISRRVQRIYIIE